MSGIPQVYCYYFCLEPTVRKDNLMRTISVTVMVVFFESGILKVTWPQLCPFLTNTRHIDNSILKDTLQFFVLRTWINIKTLVIVTETRIDEGAWKKIVTQSVHLEECCTKLENTFHLCYAILFLTNPVFKFDIALIGFKVMSTTIHFFSFWLTFDISLILQFIQCLYTFL